MTYLAAPSRISVMSLFHALENMANDTYLFANWKPIGYYQYVVFNPSTNGMAKTTNHVYTDINYSGTKNVATEVLGQPPAQQQMDSAYANVIIHEVFWHGVLGNTLESSDENSLGNTIAPVNGAGPLEPAEVAEINKKLGG